MSLCHFVIDPYKILILHALDKNHMMFICLFSQDILKGIDDKVSGYDDTQERRELEQAADMLFG